MPKEFNLGEVCSGLQEFYLQSRWQSMALSTHYNSSSNIVVLGINLIEDAIIKANYLKFI